jgi:S-DNA-T family DNA segregation ATPase FtsK/SpoIIIE
VAKRKRSSSKRRKSSSKGRSSSKQKKQTRRPLFQGGLSPDRKLDLIGVVLALIGMLTILSALSPEQSQTGQLWMNILTTLFGWGVAVIPIVMVVLGLWLVLRKFGDRLPQFDQEQVLGAILLYLALLILLHAVLGVRTFDEAMQQVDLGRGGGLLGAALWSIMVKAIGSAGSMLVLTAWFLVGAIFVMGISLPEFVTLIGRGLHAVRTRFFTPRRQPGRQTRSSPTTTTSISEPRQAEPVQRQTTPESARASATPSHALHDHTEIPVAEWNLPEMDQILKPGAQHQPNEAFDKDRAKTIEETLQSFGAPAKVVEINRGPTITQYGVEPDFLEGRGGRRIKVKVSKISALVDDLALALAAPSIRIEAPVPGKGYIGVEVPNTEISLVALRSIMEDRIFQRIESPLRIGLGMDVSGRPIATDLASMPHLLVAGTTGSGKSVCVNAIISCLLMQNTPDNMRFVMVDPKRVELTGFNGVPHLLAPVVVDLERVVPALQWVSREMDERYRLFAKEGVRNINDYNQRMDNLQQKRMHYIIVVIDELADLMMMSPDETERVITRLAQLARATGIHLVIATQRPSVDVVTGLIKANFPSRIAFAVASSVDSRVILDQPGAERLLGKGDMLFQAPDAPAPIRMQGAFVSDGELSRLIRYWKNESLGGDVTQPAPAAPERIPVSEPLKQSSLWDEGAPEDDDLDPLFDEAVAIVRDERRASVSLLQRRLRIGYTRSARLVDSMEERGIVGPDLGGSKGREVLDYGTVDLDSTPVD